MKNYKQDINSTEIPTLADVAIATTEEAANDKQADIIAEQDRIIAETWPETTELLSPDFKRQLTRIVYKKLMQRLAATSHEIAVEIMDELENQLNTV